jgi:quinolinate synthase
MSAIDALLREEALLPETYKKMSDHDLIEKVSFVKQKLGRDLYLPGHHYQKDDIIRFADDTGDSLQLAKLSAANREARFVVFCGVHFMAETADILTGPDQQVILPDMRAGCSMADMADYDQTERAWEALTDRFGNTIIPLTYVNSTAAIKAFVGRHGGACVTSSNARRIVTWALEQKKRILFLPDQHLGRNTAYDLGIPLDEMLVWDPISDVLEESVKTDKCRVILWKGHCSVHENFRMPHIENLRKTEPDRRILVHPECTWEVVQASDDAGSTSYIIDQIKKAPAGSKWAIGTEMNLVNRLIQTNPHLDIVSLNPFMCPCLTMNRIDLPHLAWSLDRIDAGELVNVIRVPEQIAEDARKALDRMLELV